MPLLPSLSLRLSDPPSHESLLVRSKVLPSDPTMKLLTFSNKLPKGMHPIRKNVECKS